MMKVSLLLHGAGDSQGSGSCFIHTLQGHVGQVIILAVTQGSPRRQSICDPVYDWIKTEGWCSWIYNTYKDQNNNLQSAK